jgi:Actinobacteria/chloroflexi VLRF1 release factor
VTAKPAAGGGVWLEVPAERFARWCDGFAQRHDGLVGAAFEGAGEEQILELAAGDGAVASCHIPFAPIGSSATTTDTPLDADAAVNALAAHALTDRTVGVILVRRGGYATGLFSGTRLLDHKVGARYVQGKTKAGGWSQQRYARRREGQAREAYAAAAEAAAKVLLPVVGTLDAVVAGGDAAAVAVLRGETRLAPLWAKERGPFLAVGDPRLDDLKRCPESFRAVRIRLVERA